MKRFLVILSAVFTMGLAATPALASVSKAPVALHLVSASHVGGNLGIVGVAHADEVAPVPEPDSLEKAIGFIPTIIEAAKSSNWLLFGGLVALVLTFVVKKYVLPKVNLGTGVLPWVSIVLGLLAGVGGAVAAGAKLEAALLAVLSGPLASTIWETIVQYFVPDKQA